MITFLDKIYRRLFIVLCICCTCTTLALTQGASNPFEVHRSSDTLSSKEVIKNKNSSQPINTDSKNVFEVYRDGDSDKSNTSLDTAVKREEAISIDTVQYENDDFEISESPIPNYNSVNGDNPFEVSHVPYRKSDLKKQAKSSTRSPAKERAGLNITKGIDATLAENSSSSNTFLFWMILFSLLLLAIVVNVQRGVVTKVIKSITNENVLKLTKREENNGLSGHFIMLYFIYFINMASFLYLITKYYQDYSGVKVWMMILGGVILVYLTRHISMSIIGYIFDITKDSSLYSFTIYTFNIAIGLLLIPINFIVAFSPTEVSSAAMYVGIGTVLLLLFIRIMRGILIGARFIGQHIFQFFTYLCTFEIAPILILMRMLSDL